MVLDYFLQIIGTSAIRISWGKNSVSRAPAGGSYRGFPPSYGPAGAPGGLHPEAGLPYFRPPPAAAAPAVDPYAAYAYALQQQNSSASSPLLQVRLQCLFTLLPALILERLLLQALKDLNWRHGMA